MGRIVIPKEIRKRDNIKVKDQIEFFVNGREIILKKMEDVCCICNSLKGLIEYNNKLVCKNCIEGLSKIN